MEQLSLKDFWGLSEEDRKEQYKYLSNHDKFLVRISMDPGMVPSQCNACKHYRGFGRCDAYPDAIPQELLKNEFQHTIPYKDDKGIQFEFLAK